MSLPSFPDKKNAPTREEAVNMILSSIAMEEVEVNKSLSINQPTIYHLFYNTCSYNCKLLLH